MDSIEYMLRMIDTKLVYLKELEKKVKLIKPITELISNEIQSINRNNGLFRQITPNVNPLPPDYLPLEYVQIWRDSNKLKQEFKYQS
ncbi:unnamed protein product [Schistosoma mattheei]|uniref:Uncharacterized protein n=1 Tax=Schistosoma mattheei TaxID=31246 RepID=A0A183NZ20_9TREM|nr:unnamed protein product [Schistosoma mattheei]